LLRENDNSSYFLLFSLINPQFSIFILFLFLVILESAVWLRQCRCLVVGSTLHSEERSKEMGKMTHDRNSIYTLYCGERSKKMGKMTHDRNSRERSKEMRKMTHDPKRKRRPSWIAERSAMSVQKLGHKLVRSESIWIIELERCP